MKTCLYIILFVLSFAGTNVVAENVSDSLTNKIDSTGTAILLPGKKAEKVSKTALPDTAAFKPNPVRAVWLGAVIPGYGQIVNKSYWKLPIVYAGYLSCAYAITLNSTRYGIYRRAYFDKTDSNDQTNSFLDLPNGSQLNETILKSAYDQYRRYRDLSIVFTVGYYAITLIEAYVDAQLFDFDISPDLSMHVRPSLLKNDYNNRSSAGLQLSLSLK